MFRKYCVDVKQPKKRCTPQVLRQPQPVKCLNSPRHRKIYLYGIPDMVFYTLFPTEIIQPYQLWFVRCDVILYRVGCRALQVNTSPDLCTEILTSLSRQAQHLKRVTSASYLRPPTVYIHICWANNWQTLDVLDKAIGGRIDAYTIHYVH